MSILTIPALADYDVKAEAQAPNLSTAKRDYKIAKQGLRAAKRKRNTLIRLVAETQIVREEREDFRGPLSLGDLEIAVRRYRRERGR